VDRDSNGDCKRTSEKPVDPTVHGISRG
jgi:hypothetical protein